MHIKQLLDTSKKNLILHLLGMLMYLDVINTKHYFKTNYWIAVLFNDVYFAWVYCIGSNIMKLILK
jgi:hypothetical protein